MKIVIGKDWQELEENGATHSIESGRNDGVKHFDHHGKFENQPCPCNNETIQAAQPNAIIGTTHFDADTFVGVSRMVNPNWVENAQTLGIDFSEMERQDLKSDDRRKDLNPTKCLMLGLTATERQACPANGVLDCTESYWKVWNLSIQGLIDSGRKIGEEAEKTYRQANTADMRTTEGGYRIGLWILRTEEFMDPGRPYDDGYDIVVIYRGRFSNISLYCRNSLPLTLPGVWANVKFDGHPHACGSERGKKFSVSDAVYILRDVIDKL